MFRLTLLLEDYFTNSLWLYIVNTSWKKEKKYIIIMYYLVFISLLDQSFKTISVIQKLKNARIRTHQKRPLQVSYWKLVLISCVFPLKVQESCPFRKTVGINWNVQHVRLTKRGLKFSNNPDGSAYQPKKGSSRGSTPGNSWWGCAARFSKSWPDSRPKNVFFRTRFQTSPPNSTPVFIRGL